MKLPTLYKRTKTGAISEWTIEAKEGATRTTHGHVGGKLVTSKWYLAEVTNEGRSNQRDPQEQAIFEAEALWKKREEKNYFTDINEIDKLVFREPMRANKWADAVKKKKVSFPVFVQPKLDGCLSKDTLVETDVGVLTLSEVVDERKGSFVKSYNESTKKVEFKKILTRMKDLDDLNESNFTWFMIEDEIGNKIKLTGNHLVYLPKLKCWRRVDALSEDDYILLK